MSRNAYHDYLKAVPLFSELDSHDLDVVGRAVTELTFHKGDVLMREGSQSREMVVVLEGTLTVIDSGEEIADIGAGGFAGEMGLLAHTVRNATVKAKTDVRVLHIDARSIDNVLEEAPQIAVKMLPIVASRVVEHNVRHTD